MCWVIAQVATSIVVFFVGIHYGRMGAQQQHLISSVCPPPRPAIIETIIDPCEIDAAAASATATLSPIEPARDALCTPEAARRSNLYLHKNAVSAKESSVLRQVFGSLHHPETPVKAEVVLAQIASDAAYNEYVPAVTPADEAWAQRRIVPLPAGNASFAQCSQVYLTRSGSRESMPNKCVAVVSVPAAHASVAFLSHRVGVQAKMVDRYVGDWATDKEYADEAVLLPLLLTHLSDLVAQFLQLLGSPFVDGLPPNAAPEADDARERRSVLVMVANEGVMDLLLNFLCSCKSAGLDTGSMVVFVGQREYMPLVQAIGAKAFYHAALGLIPRKAADSYGDVVFARLMWLKATSVFIAARAGFHVLFQVQALYAFSLFVLPTRPNPPRGSQDVDLVWLRDPFPFLQAHVTDVAFMDDGARTTRFTPFFVNSGFYFMKRNPRTQQLMERMLKCAAEISSTHSHQATLTRYLTELHSTFQLDIAVLPELLFPSGAQWHNNKKFIKQMLAYSVEEPFVFHMCWSVIACVEIMNRDHDT